MKKIMKKEVIIAFLIGIIIASGITAYAAGIFANQVSYKNGKTVEDALNDLYASRNSSNSQITIYSAAFDEIYYYENGEKKLLVITDSTGKAKVSLPSADNLVIYSSVAKDISNSSNPYSKSIARSDLNKDVFLMPDGALFWYGNFCSDSLLGGSEITTEANGWGSNDPTAGTYTINPAVLDIRTLKATANNGKYASGIGAKQKISSDYSTMHIITKNVTGAWVSASNTKNIMDYIQGNVGTLTANSNYSCKLNINDNYLHIHTDNNRTFQIDAWWID